MTTVIKEIEWGEFYSGLAKNAQLRNVPFDATFELTYGCNLQCIHCYIPREQRTQNREQRKKELSCSGVCSILDQLADLGCLYLDFTGGEIFTRPDIFEIFEYAKKRGFLTKILTNATLITPKIAKRIAKLDLYSVQVSMHGITEEVYEAITKIPSSFRHCLKGIKLLKQRGISFKLAACLMNQNLPQFSRIKSLAEKLGTTIAFSPCIYPGSNKSKENLSYQISPKDAMRLWKENYDRFSKPEEMRSNERREHLARGEFFYCSAGKSSMVIDPYGEIRACVQMPYPKYDILNSPLKRAWQRLVGYINSIQPNEKFACLNCDRLDFCEWCPVDGLVYENDFSACVPYLKEYAGLMKEWYNQRLKNKSHAAY